MSMFSIHYLIVRDGKVWNGNALDAECWDDDYGKAVRFHGEESAKAVLNGVLKAAKDACRIEEDE